MILEFCLIAQVEFVSAPPVVLRVKVLFPSLIFYVSRRRPLHTLPSPPLPFLTVADSQEAYVDSAALAESQLELQEERAAQGLSAEPTPAFEVEEVDDWEVRANHERSCFFVRMPCTCQGISCVRRLLAMPPPTTRWSFKFSQPVYTAFLGFLSACFFLDLVSLPLFLTIASYPKLPTPFHVHRPWTTYPVETRKRRRRPRVESGVQAKQTPLQVARSGTRTRVEVALLREGIQGLLGGGGGRSRYRGDVGLAFIARLHRLFGQVAFTRRIL